MAQVKVLVLYGGPKISEVQAQAITTDPAIIESFEQRMGVCGASDREQTKGDTS